MQLDNCHVVINFISKDNKSINFFANSTSKIKSTCFRNCFKNSFNNKTFKKTIRFLKKIKRFIIQIDLYLIRHYRVKRAKK